MLKFPVSLWLRAVRAPFFTASIIPVVFAAVYALWLHPAVISWLLIPIFLLCAVLLHAAANLTNDYYDYIGGIDTKDSSGSSGILTHGLMEPADILRGSYIAYAAGIILGLILVVIRGMPLLLMGLAGALGGYAYTAKPFDLKYKGFGDIMVFILMGPLLVISAYYAFTGFITARALIVSIPIGCLVAAILHANNIRDMVSDKKAGIATLALKMGRRGAAIEYEALVITAYSGVLLMAAVGLLPMTALTVILSLPYAYKNIKIVHLSGKDNPGDIARIDVRTAQLHLIFGILLILSLAAAVFLLW